MSDYSNVYVFESKIMVIISSIQYPVLAYEEYMKQVDCDGIYTLYATPLSLFIYLANIKKIKIKPIEVYHTCSLIDAIEKMKGLVGFDIIYQELLPSTSQE